MSSATLGFTLTYTAPGGGNGTASQSVVSPYTPQEESTLDIPAATPADTAFAIPFGTVDSGAVLVVKNRTALDVGLRIDGPTADGVLVAGQVVITIDSLAGDVLKVTQLAANGDPGTTTYEVLRIGPTTVRVVAHDAAFAFLNTAVASVRVENLGKYAFTVPAGGFCAVGGALPPAVLTSKQLKKASVVTTDVTVGTVETFVFGAT